MNSFLISSKIYEKSPERKKKIDEALIQMITLDVQPFKIVDDVGFKNFVHCLDPKYDLPSRTTLRQVLLKNMFMDMKAQSKSILDIVDSCAVTTEGWRSRSNDYYITVTCHFVYDYELRAVLSTNKMLIDTDHSSQNFKNFKISFERLECFGKDICNCD